jgi:hypothetical protein
MAAAFVCRIARDRVLLAIGCVFPKPGTSTPRILNTVVIGPPDCSRRRWPRFESFARRGHLRRTLEAERKAALSTLHRKTASMILNQYG